MDRGRKTRSCKSWTWNFVGMTWTSPKIRKDQIREVTIRADAALEKDSWVSDAVSARERH